MPGKTLEFTIVLDPLMPGDGVDLDAQHAAYCAAPCPLRYGPALPTIDVTMVLAEDYYGHLQNLMEVIGCGMAFLSAAVGATPGCAATTSRRRAAVGSTRRLLPAPSATA